MEASVRIAYYFTRVLNLANQMKSYGEKISDQMVVEQSMRTLIPSFDLIVVDI